MQGFRFLAVVIMGVSFLSDISYAEGSFGDPFQDTSPKALGGDDFLFEQKLDMIEPSSGEEVYFEVNNQKSIMDVSDIIKGSHDGALRAYKILEEKEGLVVDIEH